MLGDENGKFGLDVVIGLSILMVTLIFIAQYLPSIFSADKKELTTYPLAYRMTCALTDSPGYWTDGINEGFDWWNHMGDSATIGLSNGNAGVLDVDKIDELKNVYDGGNNYLLVKEALGLSGETEIYDYNISIQTVPSTILSPEYSTEPSDDNVLLIGKPIPDVGEVAIFEKRIYYDDYTGYLKSFHGESTSYFDNIGQETNHIRVEPPIESFVIDVEGLSDISGPIPELEVTIGGDVLISTADDACIETFDITDKINSYSGQQNVKISITNLKGLVICTNAGKFIGGRLSAKIVVAVW